MKFDIDRISRLAGLGSSGTGVLSEGGNRSKREEPGHALKSDKKGASYDGHALAEAEEEMENEMYDDGDEVMNEEDDVDPITEARLRHIIQMEVESMIAERNRTNSSNASKGVTLGFAGPGFRRN
jgi:hypothetical protein